jgi:hypothetical protein
METNESKRARVLVVGCALMLGLLVSRNVPFLGQTAPERFWLAGRYDGNRIIVYFDAVKFRETVPKDAVKIAYPIADSFFNPVGLPPDYVARFQQKPGAEHFSIGDHYDLLLGDGGATTVTLTTLVGFEGDEQVGNDSFIGALATPERADRLIFTRDYYVVRRHVEPPPNSPKPRFDPNAPIVRLDPDPVPFNIQTQAAALITERMKSAALPEDLRRQAEKISPTITVQRFTIGDGSTRYFLWADWRSEQGAGYQSIVRLAAWLAPSPLHFLAVEPPYVFDGVQKENLLNVVDLGSGRTGIVVYIQGADSRGIQLREYKDGADLNQMRAIQSVGVAE